MVTASETSTTNATKARSEGSHLDEQTEPASGYVSSSFTTPTFNVQSQVIDCTKVQVVFAECYCDHEALCRICITDDLNVSTSLFFCLLTLFQVLRLDIYYALKESDPLAWTPVFPPYVFYQPRRIVAPSILSFNTSPERSPPSNKVNKTNLNARSSFHFGTSHDNNIFVYNRLELSFCQSKKVSWEIEELLLFATVHVTFISCSVILVANNRQWIRQENYPIFPIFSSLYRRGS